MKRPGGDDRTWHIAVTFVVVTMVALVVVPLLVQRRVTRLRDVIEESELARTRAIQIQFNLVREMAELRDLTVSGAHPGTAARARSHDRRRPDHAGAGARDPVPARQRAG